MTHYLGVAKDQGLSGKEIDAVKAIAMSVAAVKVRAQFADVRRRHHTEDV